MKRLSTAIVAVVLAIAICSPVAAAPAGNGPSWSDFDIVIQWVMTLVSGVAADAENDGDDDKPAPPPAVPNSAPPECPEPECGGGDDEGAPVSEPNG